MSVPVFSWIRESRQIITLLVLTALPWGTACSPSLFFGGKDVDDGVKKQPVYRKLNTDCAGLDLSSSSVDPVTFRKILDCFNSNGALEPIAQLSRKLTDKELEPVLSHFNRKVLNNDRMLYQLESTFNTLSKRQLLDETLTQFGKLLSHEEWVTATLMIARRAHEETRESSLVLKALERFSTRVDESWVEKSLDYGLTFSRSSALNEIFDQLRGDNPTRHRDLDREILEPLKTYLTRDGKYGVRDSLIVETLEWLRIKDQNLLRVFDELFGQKADRIGIQVPIISHSLKTVLSPTERGGNCGVLDDLRVLFRAGQLPISCFKGAQRVENPAEFLLQEIMGPRRAEASSFLTGTLPVTLSVMAPFCELPAELTHSFRSLYLVADSSAIDATLDLISTFKRNGLHQYLFRILGQDAGFQNVYPLLSEITERGLWEDLLFFLTSLTDSQREDLKNAISFVLEEAPELEGQNVYQLIMNILKRTPSEDIGRFLRALAELNRSREIDVDHVITVLRESYYSTPVHPTIEIFRSLISEMGTTPAGAQIVDTFFKLASEPEFGASVKLIAEMSQNGQLKELLNSILTLFHKFSARGKMAILETQAPPFQLQLRHDWSSKKVTVLPVLNSDLSLRDDDSCWKVSFRSSLGEFRSEGYYDRLDQLVGCVNRNQSKTDVDQMIGFLRQKTLYGSSQRKGAARTFFELPIQWVTDLGTLLGDAGVQKLSRIWVDSIHDLSFQRALNSAEWFFFRSVNSDEDSRSGSGGGKVFAPVLSLISGVMERADREFLRILDFTSDFVRSFGFSRATEFGEFALRKSRACEIEAMNLSGDLPPVPVSDQKRIQDLEGRISERSQWDLGSRLSCASTEIVKKDWLPSDTQVGALLAAIELKECVKKGTTRSAFRAQEIIEDVRQARTSWEFFKAPGSEKKSARMSWSIRDLKGILNPLMARFLDPEKSYKVGSTERPAIQAMLNVFKYFTLPAVGNQGAVPGPKDFVPTQKSHYPPEYLARWLQERSTDYQLIPYFYPGESKPRLRYVNSLMKLELVLINADLQYLLPDNFGLKFLELIAYSWGDEKYDVWPKLVQDRFGGERARICDDSRVSEKERIRRIKDGLCPMKISDAYRVDEAFPTFATTKSILSTLKQFEFLLGYPDLPDCFQWTPEEEARLPRSTGLAGGVLKEEAKISVFNVRQLINIIEDNLPESRSRYAGGAKVLRDLFYEFLVSSPKGMDNAREAEGNNLRFVVEMVKLGLGTQASRALWNMPDLAFPLEERSSREDQIERTALLDFFRAWSTFSSHPHSTEVVRSLIRGTDREPLRTDKALIWPILENLFASIDPSPEDAVSSLSEAGSRRHAPRWTTGRQAANLAFYSLALLEQQGWTGPLVDQLRPVLASKANRDYFSNRADLVRPILESRMAMDLVKVLYSSGDAPVLVRPEHSGRQDLLGTAGLFLREPGRVADAVSVLQAVQGPRVNGDRGSSERQWALWVSRLDALQDYAGYQRLNLDDLLISVLDFFSTQSSDPSTSRVLRRWFADQMETSERKTGGDRPLLGDGFERGEMEQILLLIRDEPEAVGEILSTLGRYAGPQGDLESLLDLARSALSPTSPR